MAARLVAIITSDGPVTGYSHGVPAIAAGTVRPPGAAVLVAGAGGGVTGPGGQYPVIASELASHGIPCLRLDYRRPNHVEACLQDVQAGIEHLRQATATGKDCTAGAVDRFVVVGWSFGGAVALRAAQAWPEVVGVATVDSQTAWVGDVGGISPRPCLFMHGTGDTCLSDACSKRLYGQAKEPKGLRLFPGDDHGLTGAARSGEVTRLLVDFIVRALGTGQGTGTKDGR